MSDIPDFVIQDKNGFVPEQLLREWNRVLFPPMLQCRRQYLDLQ